MSMAASLLALIALGLDGPATGGPPLSYGVRFVEVQGLDWRAEARPFLEAVARQGGATVWTAPREALEAIGGQVLLAPRMVGAPGAQVTAAHSARRSYVADVERVADGPVGAASTVAFRPEVAWVEDGLLLALRGRRIDQGVLAEVSVHETRVDAIHRYGVGKERRPDSDDFIQATVQVPETSSSEVAGEWLIPRDGLLIVSLGVRSRPGEGLVERLAIIEAAGDIEPSLPSPSAPPLPIGPSTLSMAPAGRTWPAAFPPPLPNPPAPPVNLPVVAANRPAVDFVAQPLPVAALTTPPLPSRALPTPRNSRGEVVALPPLPEVEGFEEPFPSEEPRPSAQAPHRLAQTASIGPDIAAISTVTPSPGGPAPGQTVPRHGQMLVGSMVALPPQVARGDSAPALPSCCSGGSKAEQPEPSRESSVLFSVRIANDRLSPREAIAVMQALTDARKGEPIYDQIALGLTRYGQTGKEACGPVKVFDTQGPDGARLAVLVEANEAGRKLLRASTSTVEPACCKATAAPASPKIIMCPQAGGSVVGDLPGALDAAPPLPEAAPPRSSPKADPIVKPAGAKAVDLGDARIPCGLDCVAGPAARHPEAGLSLEVLATAAQDILACSLLPGADDALSGQLLSATARPRKTGQQEVERSVGSFARLLLEAESGYNAFLTARKLQASALAHVEAMRTQLEAGKTRIQEELEFAHQWADSRLETAQQLLSYPVALAVLNEVVKVLREREQQEFDVVRGSGTKRDEAVNRAAAQPNEGPSFRLSFSISPVPMPPKVSAEPLRVRMPVGKFGSIECRRIGDEFWPFPLSW